MAGLLTKDLASFLLGFYELNSFLKTKPEIFWGELILT